MPDSTNTTLVNDTRRKVKLATFLDRERILVQLDYRYLIFDAQGVYIDDVDFDNVLQYKSK